jgi:hypothetical protein
VHTPAAKLREKCWPIWRDLLTLATPAVCLGQHRAYDIESGHLARSWQGLETMDKQIRDPAREIGG